jgi:hypothetical protein
MAIYTYYKGRRKRWKEGGGRWVVENTIDDKEE